MAKRRAKRSATRATGQRRLTDAQRARIAELAGDFLPTEIAAKLTREGRLRPPVHVSSVTRELRRVAANAAATPAEPVAIDDRRSVLERQLVQLLENTNRLGARGQGHAFLRSMSVIVQVVKTLDAIDRRGIDQRKMFDGLGALIIDARHRDEQRRASDPRDWLLDAVPRVSHDLVEIAEALARVPIDRRGDLARPLRASLDAVNAAMNVEAA